MNAIYPSFTPFIKPTLRIVCFTKEHITAEYLSWLNNPSTVQFSEQRHFSHDYDSCLSYLSSQLASNNYFLALEVLYAGTWTHIGNIGLTYDPYNSHGDMSIIIGHNSFKGLGYGRQFWISAGYHLIEVLQLRTITAGTMSINYPMLSLFRSSNMTIIGEVPGRFMLDSNAIALVMAYGTKPSFESVYRRLYI